MMKEKEVFKETKITKVTKNTYTKESILKSKKYFNRLDLLRTLLDDGKSYTFEQVDSLIENFMKGKVK